MFAEQTFIYFSFFFFFCKNIEEDSYFSPQTIICHFFFGNIDFASGGNFDCVFFNLIIGVIQKKNTGLETQTLRLLEQETPPLHLKESPGRKTGHF